VPTDDIAALKHHAIVTFFVLLFELAAKFLIKLGVDFKLIPPGYGNILQGILGLFLIFAIVIFSVTTIALLARNALSTLRGKPSEQPPSPDSTGGTLSAGPRGPKDGGAA
jgi:hypothetical protein